VQLTPFDYDEANQVLRYTDRLDGGRVLDYQIRPASAGVQVIAPSPLSILERKEIARKVTWMFGLGQDYSSFYKVARGEAGLRKARRLAYGRVLRCPTFFEDVLKTILTTNTLWAATRRMTLNLVNAFGRPGQDGRRAFPSPEQVAAAGQAALRNKVRVGYRALAIHELGKRVASGELDIEAFKASALPTLDLRKQLLQIRGVGPYAAANLLMILGRPDFIPIDSYALKLVSLEWHRGRKITPKHVEKAFQQWGEFKGLAFWFWDWKSDGG
jgi:3-methyladenine DNA glycosylase/8-oxoguanine DNA glycosylase